MVLEGIDVGIEKMPESYKGAVTANGGYTKSEPRRWTAEEIRWVEGMRDMGYSSAQIAESVGRTHASVAIKLKRLGKADGSYNAGHVSEKHELNALFLEAVGPDSVLDLYSGATSFYAGKAPLCVSNDISAGADADYHMDALKLLCELYARGERYDLVDLDPYGSAYDCFDLAVKTAGKGLAVTFGELGHRRWKRLDFVRRYYGIEELGDFTLDALIAHVQMIGRRNKKSLVVWEAREWRNIGRAWFTVEPLKITEQWERGAE